MTVSSVNNNLDVNLNINTFAKAEEIRQSSLYMIFKLATELKEKIYVTTYETTAHFQFMPVHNFIYKCNQVLNLDYDDPTSILKDLSLLEPSSKMTGEVIKTNAFVLTTTTPQIEQTRLQILQAALQCCREKKQYKAEYLLRALFINVVRLDPAASREEIGKAIEFEQEHLETVIDLNDIPGSPQEKYDRHLESYLDFLFRLTGLQFTPDKTLQVRFKTLLIHLESFTSNETKDQVSCQDQLLITKSLVFLYTRPEWLFYRDRLKAKELLIGSQKNPEVCKQRVELDLILLQANQAIENQYVKNYPRAIYTTLLENIVTICPLCSLSEKILALSCGVKLYEAIAHDQENPEGLKTKIINTLQKIIQIGDAHIDKLDFKALRALNQCRFTYGFYLSHYFQTKEEYELACKALSTASQDFWADIKTRQAAIEVRDRLPPLTDRIDGVKIDRKNFLLLQLYKLIVQQELYDLHACFNYSKDSKHQQSIELTLPGISNIEDFLNQSEPPSPKTFSSFFLTQNVKKAEDVVTTYFAYHYLKANQWLNRNYCNSPMRFHKFELNNEEIEGKRVFKKLTNLLNSEEITTFISNQKNYPMAEEWFIQQEENFLNNYLKINLSIDIAGNKNQVPFFKTSIEIFYRIYYSILETLKKHQGDLSYTKFTQRMIGVYVRAIWNSRVLENAFYGSSNKKDEGQLKVIRHDWDHIIIFCQLAFKAYKFIDCYVPDNHDEFFVPMKNSALHTICMAEQASQSKNVASCLNEQHSKQVALYLNQKHCKIAYKDYQNSLGKSRPDLEKIKKQAYIQALVLRLQLTDNLEEIEEIEEIIYSQIPDTYEEIAKILDENQSNNDFSAGIILIAFVKSICMMKRQKVEEGIDLINKLIERTKVSSKNKKSMKKYDKINNYMEAGNFRLQIQTINNFSVFDPNQVKKFNATTLDFGAVSPKLDNDNKNDEVNELSPWILKNQESEKKNIVRQAREVLERLRQKREKKQTRASSSSVPFHVPTTTHAKAEEKLPSLSNRVNKCIGKKDMKIFNRLWEENSSSNVNAAWELRSFKNNIKITRREALQLIQALGGTYSATRGHGSHSIAHLPKLEFNGQDMGLIADYETGEMMITFTNDKALKHYQIIQLRKILLSQGFNPDTVQAS